MARASTRTILPLDTFAKILGLNPLHFNQIVINDDGPNGRPIAPVTTCEQPVMQDAWMFAGRTSREDVARAIREAEIVITEQLRYPPGPTYIKQERVELIQPANPALYGYGVGVRGGWNSVKVRNGYVISGGREAQSLISAAEPITYSDDDSDGYFETATIVFATTVTDEEEIAVFYPGVAGNFSWQIRPLASVSITAGVATVTFRREQAVLQALLDSISPSAVDGMDDANFLTTVDVYRVYNDPSQMVRFLWNAGGGIDYSYFWPCEGCGSCNCAYCVQNTQWGCATTLNARSGLFSLAPAVWDATEESFTGAYWSGCRVPDQADIWYRAGWRDQSARWPLLTMDPEWARAVALLALTYLDRPMCECDNLNSYFMHWKDDLARTTIQPSGGSSTYRLSNELLNCPLGTTRAGLHAWQHIVRNQIGEAVR